MPEIVRIRSSAVVLLALLLLRPETLPRPQEHQGGSLPAFASDQELAAYFRETDEQVNRRHVEAERCAHAAVVERGRVAGAAHAVIHGQLSGSTGPRALARLQVLLDTVEIHGARGGLETYRVAIPSEALRDHDTVTVRVVALGFVAQTHRMAVSRGDSIRLDIRLCPAAINLGPPVLEEGAPTEGESITDLRDGAVDESGIVKRHGGHLVILRRGRLFTVAIDDDRLQPVASVDAFGPDIDPDETDYTGLLVSGDKVVVLGVAHEREELELGTFRITPAGSLHYLETYQLRLGDYYAPRAPTARLIDGKLTFYHVSYYVPGEVGDPLAVLPSMRRWAPGDDGGAWERITSPQRVYSAVPGGALEYIALHTLTSCDLAAEPLRCEAAAVLGPRSPRSQLSGNAVYVWIAPSQWEWIRSDVRPDTLLCRLPLDGSPPGAIRMPERPVDQSFLEGEDGRLHVLLHPDERWGRTALLQVPLAAFGDGRGTARESWYRPLPSSSDSPFPSEFVNGHLLYGSGSYLWRGEGAPSTMYVVPLNGGEIGALVLPHGVPQVKRMGPDAVLVGTDAAGLQFYGTRLAPRPTVVQQFTVPHASDLELYDFGFSYRNDGPDSGVLGLTFAPFGKPEEPRPFGATTSVLFVRHEGDRFHELGAFAPSRDDPREDGCRTSCWGWYDNARPLFLGQRVLALLGYEIVEGEIHGDTITEIRRISFAPEGADSPRR